ncbi:hypothetical protein PENSPDRAFT_195410 [Peniophora sp. CONT]|nr:hypothetical protein PENSPDRAFT_195410 [Peniophora sp. CONT]
MTKTMSSMLERHLGVPSLLEASAPRSAVLGHHRQIDPAPRENGRVDHGHPDFLASFSRHLSSLRKKLTRGDVQLREDLRDAGYPETTLAAYVPEARSPAVSRLPPEILSTVFRELRDATSPAYQPQDYMRYGLRRCLSWHAVAGVSYKWRAVALCDPLLWTTVPLIAHLEIVLLYLSRSNGLPLRILLSPEALFKHMSIVRDNAWRINAFTQVCQ